MINSKDISLIILLAVLGFILTAVLNQIAGLITGISGINFLFVISLAIWSSFSSLIYEGRRWRFFFQFTLFSILTTPTSLGGVPFDFISRMPQILAAFLGDIGINSCYNVFKKNQKLEIWAIITTTVFWTAMPYIGILLMPLYASEAAINNFIKIVLTLSPIIIIESIIGGYLGYKIYKRIKC